MSKTDLVSANLETSPDSTRKCAHIEPIDMGNGRHDDDDGGCHDGGQQGTPGALAARCTQLPDLVQGQQQQQRRWTASSDEMQRQIAEHLRMVGDEIDRSYSMPNLLEREIVQLACPPKRVLIGWMTKLLLRVWKETMR
ncbi:PREDICTED: uncharacterized protein LOC106805778 isoform X2 [Priapulus caudatus]|uniref:Uncharacterized protein LOC106805778 isoform X2 n=1 Tax=Priapulus caudatus TaxID=37621 RepID=A0ABM1DSR5_PRICU|nr:PREDICTED: uncharacterized protein LOC106805778 isoform X2 [Priapulus caudatus]